MRNDIRKILLIQGATLEQNALQQLIYDNHLPYYCITVPSIPDAKEILESNQVDVIILDMRPNSRIALHFIDTLVDVQVILLHADGNQQNSVQAIKVGPGYSKLQGSQQRHFRSLLTSIEQTLTQQHTPKTSVENQALIVQAKREWEITIDVLPQLVCLLDTQGHILRINRTVEHWHIGDVMRVKGSHLHTLLHPTCQTSSCYLTIFLQQAWQEVGQGKSSIYETGDVLLKRALRFEIRSTGGLISSKRKRAENFIVCIVEDISERWRSEQALRESEERFRYLAEGSLQGILIHRNYTPLFVNQAYATMLGYAAPEEILRMDTVLPLFAPPDREQFIRYNNALLSGDKTSIHYEYQGLCKDGSLVWFNKEAKVVQWDGQLAVQTTIFNIDDRKQAQAKTVEALARIEKSHQDLLSIVNKLQVGTIMVDADGRVVFLSQAGQSLLGMSAQEVLGQDWMETFSFMPEAAQQLATMCSLPQPQRCKVSTSLTTSTGCHNWLEIDVQDDPRDPRGKIFLLYDKSEVYDLQRVLDDSAQFHGLVGKSLPMLHTYRLIRDVGKLETTVLIEGETGTGKELVAKAIHALSLRHNKPFIAVNCAGLSESLLGSQLFGHKRGAFTGAIADQAGFFEAANGGTLFLDEIGDMPMAVQTMLLRALQEREIVRLGESKPRAINVRIVAATQHDLQDEVTKGRFRRDLLYRICVMPIKLPALRERPEDIPLLAKTFLAQYREETQKSATRITDIAMQRLQAYAWPGNVRELKAAIEFAVIHCQSTQIQIEDLPRTLLQVSSPDPGNDSATLDEKQLLEAILQQTGGNRRQAARLLGIGKSTLYRRLASLEIPAKQPGLISKVSDPSRLQEFFR